MFPNKPGRIGLVAPESHIRCKTKEISSREISSRSIGVLPTALVPNPQPSPSPSPNPDKGFRPIRKLPLIPPVLCRAAIGFPSAFKRICVNCSRSLNKRNPSQQLAFHQFIITLYRTDAWGASSTPRALGLVLMAPLQSSLVDRGRVRMPTLSQLRSTREARSERLKTATYLSRRSPATAVQTRRLPSR